MTNEITIGTHVAVTRLGDFWISKKRADAIVNIKNTMPQGTIELDGNYISCQAVDGIVTAQQYAIMNTKRRGGWQCKYQHWHERNQQCAHHMLGARK